MSKILIIEDDMTINGLLRSIIEKSGYAADCAHNGTDGLAMGLHGDYSLILLDLMLPEKTGEDNLQEDNTMYVLICCNILRNYTDAKILHTGQVRKQGNCYKYPDDLADSPL